MAKQRNATQYFYSRPCGRGDLDDMMRDADDDKFLLTPLREGRPAVTLAFVMRSAFLLTPLREGRRNERSWRMSTIIISTHAPAGGATVRE